MPPANEAGHTGDLPVDKTSDGQPAINPFDVTLPGVSTQVLVSFKDDPIFGLCRRRQRRA